MLTTPPLVCEIHAPSAARGQTLAQIVKSCANELAQPVQVIQCRIPRNNRGSIPTHIILELPVDIASSQHEAWCLTCRLACFCPDVRVSVLVRGADAFGPSESNVSTPVTQRPAGLTTPAEPARAASL